VSQADREKWDVRWAERHDAGMPSQLVCDLADLLPRSGRALDLAGGAGRHAVWLARRGLDVTLVDISPRALALARAAEPRLTTLALDLDTDPPPPGPWDLVLVFHFLDRRLYATLPDLLAPGGLLYIVHPTRRNLERHPSPGPAYLLDLRELPNLVSGLAILHDEEGWSCEDRHEARLVARRAG
jgi:SAM-dependent methyltransferase